MTYVPAHPQCQIVMKGDDELTKGVPTQFLLGGTSVYIQGCEAVVQCRYDQGIERVYRYGEY